MESCCASPHTSLCVPAHLIYKRSIEICMRPMMPALKIHSNREYIDSFVIELSLSFLCHNSHGSLSRLMYYQKHATPLPLCLSGTHNLSLLLTLTTTLCFLYSITLLLCLAATWKCSFKNKCNFSNSPQRHFFLLKIEKEPVAPVALKLKASLL